MKRRAFVGLSLSAGVITWINAHAAFASTGCSPKKKITGQTHLITALRLLTITPLAVMKQFYAGTIGLPVSEKNGELTIYAGKTTISFVSVGGKEKRPFYHFAFNIPENKIQQAFEWQQKKTPIIHPNPAGSKNEIVNFAHWNAHSVFFLDPAGNLVEYIARHDLVNAATGDFTVKDILYASEIGLIVDDVISSGNTLLKETGLTQYKAPDAGFWPIGDESGLLLMIRKGRVWTGHTGQANETNIFKTSVTLQSGKPVWELPGYPYIIKGT